MLFERRIYFKQSKNLHTLTLYTIKKTTECSFSELKSHISAFFFLEHLEKTESCLARRYARDSDWPIAVCTPRYLGLLKICVLSWPDPEPCS